MSRALTATSRIRRRPFGRTSIWRFLRLYDYHPQAEGEFFMSMLKRVAMWAAPAAAIVIAAVTIGPAPAAPTVQAIDQGAAWGDIERKQFYTGYQGSQIMPERWFRSLARPDGKPFVDSLANYGYLPNPFPGSTLPIGFTTGKRSDDKYTYVGMTCAACHTRQIEAEGSAYRVDGAPALVDFQLFLIELDAAVDATLADKDVFAAFARKANGGPPTPDQLTTLRADLTAWHAPYHTLLANAFTPATSPWGLGRADAIQMIFNRLTGLDIGTAPDHVIVENIFPAEAPVRYPFLWDAAQQDRTQWLGFMGNGNDRLGLLRNLGQVYGVFATFQPVRTAPGKVKYWQVNSADIDGLKKLEGVMKKLSKPRWPWAVDTTLSNDGRAIFYGEGGCSACHEKPGGPPWPTPVLDVGTDTRQTLLLNRTAQTGVMEGVGVPLVAPPLKANDTAKNVLTVAVAGSYLEYVTSPGSLVQEAARTSDLRTYVAAAANGYEARRLYGVWAAAPYLHNGSVPTLAQLLTPPAQRVTSFEVGRLYDTKDVGLAKVQTGLKSTMKTGCTATNLNSGNSSCGHDYGTALSPQQKQALIEYLKTY